MKRAILIFSGYNHRGIIAFIRFCRKNNIKFYIYASSEKDPIFLTIYKKNIIGVRKSKVLTTEEIIHIGEDLKNANGLDEIIILPSTEYLNRFLLNNRKQIELNKLLIPLCPQNVYEAISDKYSFAELCSSFGINVPMVYNFIEEINLPFVIKPKRYFDKENIVNEKPIIIYSQEELANLDKKYLENTYYYQEFIHGNSYYLMYYIAEDGKYSVFSQENLIQQADGLSIIAAKSSTIHERQIAKEFAKLLQHIKFWGLIMIEVKYSNDKFYMIEANPRLWGPSQLILDANMDLFELFALDNKLLSKKSNLIFIENKKYFWTGGFAADNKRKKFPVFHEYNSEQFFKDYYSWIKNDVYNKHDTVILFQEELC